MRRKRGPLVSLLVGVVLLSASCDHLLYADGPYHGKIIDKETKQPIEGAAVVAVWWKETPVIADAMITFYDAQEVLTDQDGKFTILGFVGGSINPLAKLQEPVFVIFKPGYEALGETRESAMPRENGNMLVELGRLTSREERLKNLRKAYIRSCLPKEVIERQNWPDDSPYCVPEEKMSNLIRLKTIEESNLTSVPKTNPPTSKR